MWHALGRWVHPRQDRVWPTGSLSPPLATCSSGIPFQQEVELLDQRPFIAIYKLLYNNYTIILSNNLHFISKQNNSLGSLLLLFLFWFTVNSIPILLWQVHWLLAYFHSSFYSLNKQFLSTSYSKAPRAHGSAQVRIFFPFLWLLTTQMVF